MMKNGHFITSPDANDAFIKLATGIFEKPDYISSPRNIETKEWLNVSVTINNPYDRLVKNKFRNLSVKYALGEWLWYLSGSDKLVDISYYSKFWSKISDDGITINSAYGARFFGKSEKNNVNQWENVKNELLRDSFSRRAILLIPVPQDLNASTKDMPCTLSLQFLIRDNKLSLICNMRSNDLILGFPYDVFAFTLFQELMLLELKESLQKLEMGAYFHNVGSLHIYDKDYEKIKLIISNKEANNAVEFPKISNLHDLEKLLHNENIIRNKVDKPLLEVNDPFCIKAQDYLING